VRMTTSELMHLVTVTDDAGIQVRKLLNEEGNPAMGLRLGIKGGGCSGLSYVMDFTEEQEGDTVIEYDGFRVFLDRKSTIYLSGITLDHQSGLEGKGFVFQNPAATNTCGCGEKLLSLACVQDKLFDLADIKLCIDMKPYLFLNGLEIDYSIMRL